MRRRHNRSQRTYGEPITLAIIGLVSAAAGLTSNIIGKKAKEDEQAKQAQLQQQQMIAQQQAAALEAQTAALKAQAAAPLSKAIIAGMSLLALTGITVGVLWYLGKTDEPTED